MEWSVGLTLKKKPVQAADLFSFDSLKAALDSVAPTVELIQVSSHLTVRTKDLSVASLNELRSQVLSGEFDAALTAAIRSKPRIDKLVEAHGAHVVLTGLKSRPGLNGQSGVIASEEIREGRWEVKVGAETIKVKPLNLAPPHAEARADCTGFAIEFETSMLSLDTLTSHQRAALDACSEVEQLHLRAPAGAGKTFIALHRMLHILANDGGARVLFIARNEGLAIFAAAWLAKRAPGGRRGRASMVDRLSVLHEPLHAGPRTAAIRGDRIVLSARGCQSPIMYCMVVVDEAHHLYSVAESRDIINAYIKDAGNPRVQLTLLSDISQSLGRSIPYPPGVTTVDLSEVVRCSKRIVAGAMAFQLGGDTKLLTACHHQTTGPPLRSFLFELGVASKQPMAECGESSKVSTSSATSAAQPVDRDRFSLYAQHTLRAVAHARATFPGLSLHGRLALVVPDEAFRASLEVALQAELASNCPDWRVRLVLASIASAHIGPLRNEHADDGDETISNGSAGNSAANGSVDDEEDMDEVVLDTVQQFDGLERLIVIAVGLDSPIMDAQKRGPRMDVKKRAMEHDVDEQNHEGSNSQCLGGGDGGDHLGSRSALYRAITRAHLMAMVVNESVQSGWLEFLGHVRLREDESFDRKAELARIKTQAVESAVLSQISQALCAAASARQLTLHDEVVTMLVGDVAEAQQLGNELETAAQKAVDAWQKTVAFVAEGISDAVVAAQFDPPPTQAQLTDMTRAVAIEVHKGTAPRLEPAIDAVLGRWREKEQRKLIESGLQAAAGALRTTSADGTLAHRHAVWALDALSEKSIAALIPIVAKRVAIGTPLNNASAHVMSEWRRIFSTVIEAFTRTQQNAEGALEEVEARGLSFFEAIAVSVLNGESVGAAVAAAEMRRKTGFAEQQAESAINAVLSEAQTLNATESAPSSVKAPRPACSVLGCMRRRPQQSGDALEASHCDLAGAVLGLGEAAKTHIKAELASLLCGEGEALDPQNSAGEALNADDVLCRARTALYRWAWRERQVSAKLAAAAEMEQMHISDEERLRLVPQIVRDSAVMHKGLWVPAHEGIDQHEGELDDLLQKLVQQTLAQWMQTERAEQEREAQISSALEAAAAAQRVQLSDAATAKLKLRIVESLARGDSLSAAVEQAIADWHRQLVRRQVQQTVWDTSGNTIKTTAGLVKFMPYKQACLNRGLDYETLVYAFEMLNLESHGTFARVCKLWRSVIDDSSWKPELLVYAWGAADVTGLSVACPKPTLLEFSLQHQVLRLVCADNATLALMLDGSVWHWGRPWVVRRGDPAGLNTTPQQLPELHDVMSIACTPPGYFHGRGRVNGYSCAAVTREGALYTWGTNSSGQLLHAAEDVNNPTLVDRFGGGRGARERVTLVAVGMHFIALRATDVTVGAGVTSTGVNPSDADGNSGSRNVKARVYTCGRFCSEAPHDLREWPQLQDLSLRSLTSGAFHCCALTTCGKLYTWGDIFGQDRSNGNLLGHGEPSRAMAEPVDMQPGGFLAGQDPNAEPSDASLSSDDDEVDDEDGGGEDDGFPLGIHHGRNVLPPRCVVTRGLGPISEVQCSTYGTIAITVDGRVFSWGDSDGNALGHSHQHCHTPMWLSSLRGLSVSHGALAYTNAAVATAEGRCFVWGGGAWEGGIAANANRRGAQRGPVEVVWGGVSHSYRCSSVALAHRHGYLIFRRKP